MTKKSHQESDEKGQAVAIRDKKGRWLKGHPGGPGNPYLRQVSRLRHALLGAVTPEDLVAIVQKLISQAKAGDVQATRLLLSYVIGRAPEAQDPDWADIREAELTRARRALEEKSPSRDPREVVNQIREIYGLPPLGADPPRALPPATPPTTEEPPATPTTEEPPAPPTTEEPPAAPPAPLARRAAPSSRPPDPPRGVGVLAPTWPDGPTRGVF